MIIIRYQKYITRSVHLGNTSMTHQMYEWAIFSFAPSANLRARISNTASDWTNFKSILALNKKCARAIFHIRHFVQSEAVFEIRASRLADGANLKIAHSYIWCVIEVLPRWTLLLKYFWRYFILVKGIETHWNKILNFNLKWYDVHRNLHGTEAILHRWLTAKNNRS